MSRCRFVQPKEVRLYLVDVHRRAKQTLEASPLPETKNETEVQAVQKKRTDALAVLQGLIDEGVEDGHFVDVKEQLNAGEAHDVFSRQVQQQGIGDKALVDYEQVWNSRLVAYILSWSLVDQDGKPVPFSAAALKSIDEDTDAEIRAAVDFHETTVEAARAARKNNRGGALVSEVTSPSVA